MDKYRVISLLGEGSFGRVYKAVQNSDSKFVALKVISKRGRSVKELKGLRRECEIQRHLHHPNIIQMLDSFETENEIVVITEFAHVELNAILGKEGYLPEKRVQAIVWDLVSALYYLHSHRVLHRDLKPQNILLDTRNCAKLCDFGFARNMSTGTHVLTSIKGTPLYMAPELIEEQPYDHNADLWSLGCIIYELLVGAPPFRTASILHLIRLIRHEQIQWPSFISENCISFLKGLLQKNPNKRLTWPEILNHPFVEGHILINENAPPMPLTRPMSANTLQIKEQQRKEHFVQKSENPPSKNAEENLNQANETPKPKESGRSSYEGLEKSDSKGNSQPIDKLVAKLSVDDTNGEEESNNNYKSASSESSNRNLNSQEKLSAAINIHEDSHPIENDEWIVFLHRTIEEVMAGETLSLVQPNLTNIIVSPLRNSSANPKVLGYVANLFSLPFVMRGIPEGGKLEQVKKVYLEVKLVPNLVYATKLLARSPASNYSTPTPANSPTFANAQHENYKSLMDLTDDDLQALEHIFVLLCYLVHLDVRFLNQFCDAVAVLNIYALLQRFLMLSKKELRIVTDLLAILTQLLRKTPENFELVDRVISRSDESKRDLLSPSEERLDFVHMLRHSDCVMSERVCFLLAFLAKTSRKTLEGLWNEKVRETLEALVYDSMENVRNAAEIAVEEIKVLDFYYFSS